MVPSDFPQSVLLNQTASSIKLDGRWYPAKRELHALGIGPDGRVAVFVSVTTVST